MSTIRFKTFSGSFSRYWNEHYAYSNGDISDTPMTFEIRFHQVFPPIISCSFYWATIVSLFHHCVSPAVNLHVIPPVSLMALIAWRHSVFLLVFALLLTKSHI